MFSYYFQQYHKISLIISTELLTIDYSIYLEEVDMIHDDLKSSFFINDVLLN
jgi:hypothetical protein